MKRIGFLIFVIVSLIIIYNFFNSIYTLWHKKDVITKAQLELKQVQQENTNLKKQLSTVNNPEFVEEQARDKLFLVKPGENTVVIPKNLLPTPTALPEKVLEKPNWQKWLAFFWY